MPDTLLPAAPDRPLDLGARNAFVPMPAVIRPITAVLAELWKGLLIMWSFKFNVITEVLGLFLVFLGINFFMGYGSFQTASLANTLLGFCLWTYAIFAISNMSFALREEQQQGTIEQMCMGQTSFATLLFGRTMATFLWTTLIILIGGGLITWGFGLELGLNAGIIPVMLLTIAGLYGLGYLVGAATLLFKNILSLANLLQNMLLFLNGAIVPVTFFPAWLLTATRVLPTTLGIEVMRMITLEGHTLRDAWQTGLLPLLAAHSTLWFTIGLGLFLLADREVRRRGLMGQF